MTLWGGLAGLAFIMAGFSESHQCCERTQKSHRTLHEERPGGAKAIVRLELHIACVAESTSQNEGSLTVLTTDPRRRK